MTSSRAFLSSRFALLPANSAIDEDTPKQRPWALFTEIDKEADRTRREAFDALKRRALFSQLLSSPGFFFSE